MPPKIKRKGSSATTPDKIPSPMVGYMFNRPQEELTGPPVDKTPRFVCVKLCLGPFKSMVHHPAHFELVLPDSTTMHGLKELIQLHMCYAASTIAIFRDASCSRASYIAPSLTFEQCGINGGSKEAPTKAQLFYDFTPPLRDCPILMYEHILTKP